MRFNKILNKMNEGSIPKFSMMFKIKGWMSW